MSALGKFIKADVALHLLRVAAAGLGLYAATRGLKAALGHGDKDKDAA
ncbi:MAG TPA: hypothetical protein VE326_11125 [Candidatus Binatia bacterium]|nr:hypothetical protein [Candidatus Binatia bacterium]